MTPKPFQCSIAASVCLFTLGRMVWTLIVCLSNCPSICMSICLQWNNLSIDKNLPPVNSQNTDHLSYDDQRILVRVSRTEHLPGRVVRWGSIKLEDNPQKWWIIHNRHGLNPPGTTAWGESVTPSSRFIRPSLECPL